ncbi:MAG: dihydrodipicolinate synthase family protein [Fuerstiella sp.]|jgi:dihydrodipicolinate synthase/N-acetylneuraminate lyase|nr:dihydrodipicolinate synthase family protein [Fuerstiella sp.]
MTEWRNSLNDGVVIPACPLALNEDGSWSERYQRALLSYYLAAGAGGLAIGVHTTQFEIRDPQHGLYKPVLQSAAQFLDNAQLKRPFTRVAGICGRTEQAVKEAQTAADLGYHCGLLNLSALQKDSDDALIAHCAAVGEVIPIFGFYLHPGVGGRVLSYEFWRRLCDVQSLIAIKIAAFDRYQTWDVMRAVIESGRTDVAMYTGNDDNIIADLLTRFEYQGVSRRFVGGLLGQWAVWTKAAVDMLKEIKVIREQASIPTEWLTRNASLTDANAVIFDAANNFAGCIPGVNEVLRRQGLLPSSRCLDPKEVLSPGQATELDRVCAAYPFLKDEAFVAQNSEQWLAT